MAAEPNTGPDDTPVPTAPETTITACPGCDLIIPVPPIPDGHYLACRRCGAPISRDYPNSIDRVLTLSIAGLLIYLPALFLPLMTLSSLGIKESGNVIDTCLEFYNKKYYFVSFVMVLTAVIFPFLKLFLPFIISLCVKLNVRSRWLVTAFKPLKHLEEWGMVEVYLLGILITLIKMSGMASIDFNSGFFCFVGLVLLTIATNASLDRNLFWHLIGDKADPATIEKIDKVARYIKHNPELLLTGVTVELMRCHECGQLVTDDHPKHRVCPRCHSPVEPRISGSLSKTWALVITSILLFFPANLLPIMRVDFLGVPERSTILDGILYFLNEGSYGIGLIILTASILVPLFKIVGLIIILTSIRSGKNLFLRQKATMFRFIEFVGRWSMLDIFVVALLTVLVNFGFLTSIHSAPGATFFCMVVVATMFAALVFDPRILWDRCDPPRTSSHPDQQGNHEPPIGN